MIQFSLEAMNHSTAINQKAVTLYVSLMCGTKVKMNFLKVKIQVHPKCLLPGKFVSFLSNTNIVKHKAILFNSFMNITMSY